MSTKQNDRQFLVGRDVLTALSEIRQLLATGQPLSTELVKLMKVIGETLGASVVILYRVDSETRELQIPPVVWGELRQPKLLQRQLNRDAIVFKMSLRKNPFYAADVTSDWDALSKIAPEAPVERFIQREGIKSSVGVPLVSNGIRLGVLFVNFRALHDFGSSEKDLIELFAMHIVIILNNALLLERERRTVRQVSMAISSDAGLEETAGQILDELKKVVGYRKATMQLIHNDNRTLLAYRGFDSDQVDPELLGPISKDKLIRRVVSKGKPLILTDTATEPGWRVFPFTGDVHSWVGVPLCFAGRPVGLLTLDHDQPGYYTAENEAVLTWFADQAAVAIENARLLELAQHRIRDLQILNEVTEIISSQLNTHELLEAIIDRIRVHLKCSHCSIFFPVLTDGKILLTPEIISGESKELIRSRRFKPGEGIVGWVYKTGQAILLADARNDLHFSPARQRPDVPRSMMVVPLQVGGRTVGVISADQDACAWFNDSDKQLLQTLGRQAGIAIQRNHGLELLGDVGRRINTVENVDEILKLIVSEAIKLSNVTSGVIYLVSRDGKQITKSYKYPHRSFHPGPRLNKKSSLTRQVIASKQILKCPDASNDKRVNPLLRKSVRSMIALPLIYEDNVIGVLFLNDRTAHDFTETEVLLLATLANQAATALYNANLLADLEHQVRMHSTLNEVDLKLTDLRDELKILKTVARSAVKTMACWHCSVFLVKQDQMIVAASYGKLRDQLQPGRIFSVGQGVAGWVAMEGKPALVLDTKQDPRFEKSWTIPFPRSLVNVPIMLDNKVYGVISAEDPKPMVFQERDLRLMQTFALQVSQALRNARQITELLALNRAGRAMSSTLEPDALLETLLETVKDTMKCLVVRLFTVGIDGDLVPHLHHGEDPDELEAEVQHFQMGGGLAGWVAEHRCSANVPNVGKDSRFLPTNSIPSEKPYSMLLAPMVFKDRLLGVISVDKNELDGFDENDEHLLETLASQAAVVYENARLFREAQQRVEELDLLHNVSTRLMTLNSDALLKFLLEGAMGVTDTEVGAIYLLSEDGERIVKSLGKPEDFSPTTYNLSNSGLTHQIFATGEPVVIQDVEKDIRVSVQIQRMGIHSFIGLPLKVSGRVIGVLYLNDLEPHKFTEAELALGSTLASQAAVAIENARLFERAGKNTNAQRRIVQIVGTIGAEEDPLPVILKEIIQLFPDAFYGTFAMVEADAERLVSRAIYKDGEVISGKQIPRQQQVRDWKVGITGHVARHGHTYLSGDVSKDAYYQLGNKATVSEMVVPLKEHDGRVIGVLKLESEQQDAFGQEDASLCEDLARVAAIALEKGDLYRDLEQRVSHLDALSQVARQVSNLTARQEIFNIVVDVARKTLHATRCTLFVFEQYEEKRALVPEATSGMRPKDVQKLVFRLGEGLAGWVAQEGRSMRTSDANRQEYFIKDRYSRDGLSRPMILAPLWVEGQITGVISADRDGGPVFEQDDLRFLEILAAEAGIFLLRRQHLDEIRRRFNPYTVGGPVRNPQEFYGRKKLIQEILDGIHNNNYILYGERRIGKTSLLLQVEHHLDHLAVVDKEYFFLPVYASLQGVIEEGFFSFLARRVEMATMIPPRNFAEDAFDHNDLQDYLLEVFEELKKRIPERQARLVLLIDEMDVFMGYGPQIHERFRNLFMNRCGEGLRMIMAGLTVQRVQTDTSPWFNLARISKVSQLSEDEAWNLVTQPVANYYSYEAQALHRLIETSNCKPIELQRLAFLSVNAMLDRILPAGDDQPGDLAIFPQNFQIQLQDIEKAIQKTLGEKEDAFRDFWVGLRDEEKLVLRNALAGGGLVEPGMLFTRERLYNITYDDGDRLCLTSLFAMWLGGLMH